MKRVVYPERPAQPSLADVKKNIEFRLSEPNKIQFTEKDGKVLAEVPVDKLVSKEHNDSLDALAYALRASQDECSTKYTTGTEERRFKLNLRDADLGIIADDICILGSPEDRENFFNIESKLRDMKEAIDSPQFYTYLEDFDERMECLKIRAEELRKGTVAKPDMVNHPPHYNVNGFEVIDIIKAFTADLTGIEAVDTANAIKYILRWKHKNGVEDLKKAKWYIEHLINEKESK